MGQFLILTTTTPRHACVNTFETSSPNTLEEWWPNSLQLTGQRDLYLTWFGSRGMQANPGILHTGFHSLPENIPDFSIPTYADPGSTPAHLSNGIIEFRDFMIGGAYQIFLVSCDLLSSFDVGRKGRPAAVSRHMTLFSEQ